MSNKKYRLVEYQFNNRPVKWVVEKRHPILWMKWGIIESCFREEDNTNTNRHAS